MAPGAPGAITKIARRKVFIPLCGIYHGMQSVEKPVPAPQVILKTIDLRELGVTSQNLENIVTVFLRYFEDPHLRLFSTVFVYCKNSYYCVYDGEYRNFYVVRWHCGRCCNADEFQQYFLMLYNKIIESGKVPPENEVESKILEFYKTHIQGHITIYKILETIRTIWVVKLPNDC